MEGESGVPLAREGRKLLNDLHHGLREDRAVRDAEALSYVLACAREAGAPEEDLDEMAREYLVIARELIRQGPKRRRRPWMRGRGERGQLPPPKPPRELPPGTP